MGTAVSVARLRLTPSSAQNCWVLRRVRLNRYADFW